MNSLMESSTIQKPQIPNTTKWLKTMYQNVQLAKKKNREVSNLLENAMQSAYLPGSCKALHSTPSNIFESSKGYGSMLKEFTSACTRT